MVSGFFAGFAYWFPKLFGFTLSERIGTWAFFVGEKNITRSDWAAFLSGLTALPVWYLTNDPFWAVVIITAVNCAAYYPTFRKSWIKPHEEQILMFFLSGTRFVLSYMALDTVNATTALIPVSTFLLDFGIVAMLIFRRKQQASVHG